MNTTYEIPLENAVTGSTRRDNGRFNSLVYAALMQEWETLARICSYFCEDDRGSVEATAENVRIDPDNVSVAEDLSGYVFVDFLETAYYGCRDKNVAEWRDDVRLDFVIDQDRGVIVFSVSEPMKRDPEEF